MTESSRAEVAAYLGVPESATVLVEGKVLARPLAMRFGVNVDAQLRRIRSTQEYPSAVYVPAINSRGAVRKTVALSVKDAKKLCDHLRAISSKPSPKYLYLIEIEKVCAKIGVTSDLELRLSAHRNMSKAFGRRIGKVWHMETPQAQRIENLVLKRFEGDHGEYLRVPFADVLRFVQAELLTESSSTTIK